VAANDIRLGAKYSITATVKFDDASDSSLPKGTYTATVTIPEHDPIGAQDPFRIK